MNFGGWTLNDAMPLYEQYCLSRRTTPGSDEDEDEFDEDDAYCENEDFENDDGF